MVVTGTLFSGESDDDKNSEYNNDVKKELLTWCKTITEQYNVDVKNFYDSWQDGKLLCALLNHYHPEKLDFTKIPSDSHDRLDLALKTASSLGIPELMDMSDFYQISEVDERSVSCAFITQI